MSAFVHHFVFEFKTGLRNPTQLLMNYLFPLGFYVLMGLIMTRIYAVFAQTLIPSTAIVAAMSSTVLGLPGTLVEAREAGIYRSFKINGVPALSILSIPVVTTAFQVLVVTAIITVSGPLFNGALPSDWGGFVLVSVVMAFAFSAIGALIGVVATESRSTVLLSQLIFLPAMVLGGLMMPIDVLPASMLPISMLLPATHVMQAYLGLAFGQPTLLDPWVALLIFAATGLLSFVLSVYLFSWDGRNRARRGHPALAVLALAPCLVAVFLV